MNGWMPTWTAFLLLPLLACGDDQQPQDAAALWTKIQTSKYRSFARPAGFEQRKASDQPHGAQVEVFFNDVAKSALTSGAKTWPEGSLFVKDGYDNDGDLDVVTAMEKRNGAWFYVEWNAEGESIYSGRPSACIKCHGDGDAATRTARLP